MANMSYCKFQNTLDDLTECRDALNELGDYERELSRAEAEAAKELIRLCGQIASDYSDD